MLDYYSILEVKDTADEAEIKKQFRILAKKYHPDVNPDDENAASKFAKVTEAYEILSDPKAREKYDRARRTNSKQHAHKTESESTEPSFSEKYTESESVKVDFQNWDKQFEDFFAFNPKTAEVNKEKMKKNVQKAKVSREFEDFFGFRPKKK